MKSFRSLAVVGALVAFGIAILGSWIRINGAGMTCPDWPLCQGHVVPALHGGVVLEWSHRLGALLETLLVVAIVIAGWRVRRRLLGAGPVLGAITALFVVQVVLGAATVRFTNSPLSVVLHWAAGMGLLAALAVLAVLATARPGAKVLSRSTAAGRALTSAAALGFITMGVGAYVSSSGAGLACSTLPTCDGALLGSSAGQFVQMLHRAAAGIFALGALVATLVAFHSGSRRTAALAATGMLLVLVQIALGAVNVAFGMPTALREAHAANAAAAFVAFIVAAVFASLDGARNRVPLHGRSLAPVGRAAAQQS